jgi:hypothetical protein
VLSCEIGSAGGSVVVAMCEIDRGCESGVVMGCVQV